MDLVGIVLVISPHHSGFIHVNAHIHATLSVSE